MQKVNLRYQGRGRQMKLTKQEVRRVLAALAIAEAWEDSLMQSYAHMKYDPEYGRCRKRKELYRSMLQRLTERSKATLAGKGTQE